MSKDRTGVFYPKKGKPTDTRKEDPYTPIKDELPEDAHLMHPNRNINKKREQHLSRQQDKPSTTGGLTTGGSTTGDSKKGLDQDPETVASSRTNKLTQAVEWSYQLDKESLTQLANHRAERCISLYLPAHQAGMEVNMLSDATLCKMMLQQIDQRLQQEGISRDKIEKWLEPIRSLSSDDSFWRAQAQGLAIFIAEEFCRYIKLPEAPRQEWLVNDHFLLTPLVPFISNEAHFYVLVLSKHQAKLFRGDKEGLMAVNVAGMPDGIEDDGGGYQGIGEGQPDEKQDIAHYFTEVSRTLDKEVLGRETAPLLLAGVDYLHPIYSSVSHYKHIAPCGLKGNFDRTSLPELDQAARKILHPRLNQEVRRWLDHYNDKSAGALATDNIRQLISGAHFGQVGRLFIEDGSHIWGRFDPQANKREIHDRRQPGDDCLVNQAAVHTLLHGGFVHLLTKEQMPAKSAMAGLLRYP